MFEYFLQRKTPSSITLQAVFLMLLGAFLSGVKDSRFDLNSYLIVFFYNSITAIYLVLINRVSSSLKVSSFDLMFYNSFFCAPLIFLISSFKNDFFIAFTQFPHLSSLGFQISLAGSSFLAFALNYTIFWNTRVNSALSQTVSGQVKDLLTVFLGVYFFNSQSMDSMEAFACLVGFVGSAYYAYGKVCKNSG
eukprot:Sdes_comp15336_c0_seq2m4199